MSSTVERQILDFGGGLPRGAGGAPELLCELCELRDSEGRFGELMDALPAAIYTTDAEGRITHFNAAAVEFSGRVPELGTDQWCVSWKLYRPDGSPLPHSECPMAVALKENRTVRGSEIIVERPDGTRLWVMPYPMPLRDSQGRVTGGINMLVDITERKRAEEAQARLAAIVDSSDDAIVGKTLEGIITSWNRGAERIFGYTAAEAVGRHISLIIPEERLAEEAEVLARLRQGDTIDHFETERQAKDGRRVQISLTVSPIRDTSGRIIGASKTARDITERKRSDEQLREAQKLESIGLLAGGIAHDFNNLLTSILGNTSLALGTLPAAHPAKELLNQVISASERAAELTRQMLAYAGKGYFALQTIDLSELVRKIGDPLRASISGTVRLRLELGNQLPPIKADSALLEQLIMSLAVNGAEAIGEGRAGTLRLGTALWNVNENDLRQNNWPAEIRPGRYVLLEVHDTGCGMDENTRARIFEPFFSTKFTGRGLGLAAVSGIVRGLKGAIKVSSTPGEGSTFQVLFPAIEDRSAKRGRDAGGVDRV
jgi:PAS domain S-box-containing protein